MLDQTIQSIENRILQEFPAGHSYSRTQILEAELPSGIKHFLVTTLQRRSEIEAAELLNVRSEWFDADDDEYQLVIQQAVLTLGNLARFPASEWPKAVHQAVEHVVEYLISPVSLLVRFVFAADSSSISAADLLRKAGYFSDYPYISRAVEAYLSRKKTQRIIKVEFVNALYQVDLQITDRYDSKAWLKLLSPLVKLAELPTPGLPVSFVVRFFEDKGQSKLSRFVQETAASKRAELVSLDSLKDLIDHFLNDAFEPVETLQESPIIPTPVPIQREVPAPTDPVETDLPSPKVALPLWKKFQKADSSSPPAESANTAEPLWKAFSRKKEEHAEKDVHPENEQSPEKEERPAKEGPEKEKRPEKDERPEKEVLNIKVTVPKPEPRPDVSALVLGSESAQKERFIWQLFAGNHSAFDETMQSLATAPDWTSASEIIANKVFRPFKVDIYSATAVDFTNAVESRYSGLRS
ncbi:MAG: hypothetical protein O3B41_07640 [Bacteroidetes bacterium]|nr:hypothetical protein [Bacteroidota bacterium]